MITNVLKISPCSHLWSLNFYWWSLFFFPFPSASHSNSIDFSLSQSYGLFNCCYLYSEIHKHNSHSLYSITYMYKTCIHDCSIVEGVWRRGTISFSHSFILSLVLCLGLRSSENFLFQVKIFISWTWIYMYNKCPDILFYPFILAILTE